MSYGIHPRRRVLGYDAAHKRIRRLRGPASDYDCAHCGWSADDWAYNHADPDPDEKRESAHGAYSLDPERYLPLCKSCHTRFDRVLTFGHPSRYR